MKTNLILISTLTFLLLLIFCETGFTQTTTADYYNVKAGNGKGLRLWSSNSYKISLGNYSHHKYGPVTDYSIKTTMNNSPNRGWTWGVLNQTPVAALNTQGNFQIKGWMKNISRQYYFGDVQRLSGDNGSALNWRSNNSSTTQMLFLDKENKLYGVIQGAGNGNFFGLRDGDNNWSILAERDKRTSFYINNSEKMRISLSGLVNINTNRDASGTPGTGALEIDGKLRLDGNEIITNSNTGLYLQDNNNGDLRIDGGTLKVDASANRVGIGTNTPDYKLDVNGTLRAKEVRVQTGWSDHVFLPEYNLPSLEDEEAFIQENGHLLGFESEKAMGGEVKVAEVTNRQQEAIEKLMLHVIELKKEIEALKANKH